MSQSDGPIGYLLQPSREVRDSLLAAPSVASQFDVLIIFSRWDVLVRPVQGAYIPTLADTLRNLDNLTLTDAAQLTRVFANNSLRLCEPPGIFVHFPLHYSPEMVVRFVAGSFPFKRHQDLGIPGQLLLTFPVPKAAELLYGLQVSTGAGSITFTTGSGDKDAGWERAVCLPPCALLQDRQALLAAVRPEIEHAPLSSSNLLALESGNGGPARGALVTPSATISLECPANPFGSAQRMQAASLLQPPHLGGVLEPPTVSAAPPPNVRRLSTSPDISIT